MFIDRKAEFEQLGRLYNSERAELFVLYGRRASWENGTFACILCDKPHIFFIATASSDNEQLTTFSQQVYGFNHVDVPKV